MTSTLDINTERAVVDYIRRFRQGKTAIAVTHRIHTVQDSDWIMILEDGKIVEQVTYEEVLRLHAYSGSSIEEIKGVN